MKKRFLILFMTAIMVFVMCGCGGSSDTSGQEEQAADTTQAEESSDASQMTYAELAEYYVFELDGKEYSLPCSVSDFTDNGWYIDQEQLDFQLDTNTTTLAFVDTDGSSGDRAFYLDIVNLSDETKAVSESLVSGINLDSKYNCTCLTLKKAGVKVDVSSKDTTEKAADQLKKAYGTDEDVYTGQDDESILNISWYFSRPMPYGGLNTWGEGTNIQYYKDGDNGGILSLYYQGPKE